MPPLELRSGGVRWHASPDRAWLIGREGDIRPVGSQISRRHALLEPTVHGWVFTDCSRNGTYLGGRRITKLLLNPPLTLLLGIPPDGVPLHIALTLPGAHIGAHIDGARRPRTRAMPPPPPQPLPTPPPLTPPTGGPRHLRA